MDKIKIGEKEYPFKLTLESWKRLKEANEITPTNIQEKINQDMAGVISALAFYGLSPADRQEITQDILEQSVDLTIGKQITTIVEKSLSVVDKDDDPKN